MEVVAVSERGEPPAWPIALWAAVGVLTGLGIVGILSIGIFALALAALLAVVGVVLPASRSRAALALIPGLGVLPLVVALNNLSGPGQRCWSNGASSGCEELLNPLPFAIPGLLAVVVGGLLVWRFVLRARPS